MPLPQQKLIPGILLLLVAVIMAAPPVWWSAGNSPVIDVTAAENNKGPANVGQAKHMVKSALEALREKSPTAADQVEGDLTAGPSPIVTFSIPDPKTPEWIEQQKAPLLIGQLKALSAPFYQRLHVANPEWLQEQLSANQTKDTADPANYYPWSSDTSDDSNRAVANIGQLKAVFSLSFETLSNESDDDTDNDGLDDSWELTHFGNLDQLANGDTDGDGLLNIDEFLNGTDPNGLDSDRDGLNDYDEIHTHNTDPNRSDSDGDSLGDAEEINTHGTNPNAIDSDGDGMPDGWEVYHYLEPNDPADGAGDLDFDGLTNYEEYLNKTYPDYYDSDGDGLDDYDEVKVYPTDPNNYDSDGDDLSLEFKPEVHRSD